jgi:hypothetical protein
MSLSLSPARIGCAFVLACVILFSSGCGGVKLYSVSGKVTAGDQPVTAGLVSFIPDDSKGNKSSAGATGQIESDGTYSLNTNGKSGAPAGWYKVTVTPGMPAMGSDMTMDPKAIPKLGINSKYSSPKTTDLNVEVKESGGSYDLKLSK